MKPQYTVDISSSTATYAAVADSTVKDSIDTYPVIRFVGVMIAQLNWTKRLGFTFSSHTLVWCIQTLTQFFRTGFSNISAYVTKVQMTARLEKYNKCRIILIHPSCPGLLSAIDVVNEDSDDCTGKVLASSNEWYTVFDESRYIMDAFQFARNCTGQFGKILNKLYYNDYNTDVSAKSNGSFTDVLEPSSITTFIPN